MGKERLNVYLNNVRHSKNVTVMEMAEYIGCCENTIYALECGVGKMSFKKLYKYCKKLGLNPREVVRKTENDFGYLTGSLGKYKGTDLYFNLGIALAGLDKSPKEIAKELDIHLSTLYNWLAGDSRPSGRNLLRLSSMCDVGIRDLCGHTEEYRVWGTNNPDKDVNVM